MSIFKLNYIVMSNIDKKKQENAKKKKNDASHLIGNAGLVIADNKQECLKKKSENAI